MKILNNLLSTHIISHHTHAHTPRKWPYRWWPRGPQESGGPFSRGLQECAWKGLPRKKMLLSFLIIIIISNDGLHQRGGNSNFYLFFSLHPAIGRIKNALYFYPPVLIVMMASSSEERGTTPLRAGASTSWARNVMRILELGPRRGIAQIRWK